MADYRERIDQVATLMDEFGLAEAQLESEGFTIGFRRKSQARSAVVVSEEAAEFELVTDEIEDDAVHAPANLGNPITSPMTGIYYGSPSPNTPMFVKEGDTISAGQIVGLIEAMKVFNEIPSPISGVVRKVVAESGQIVQPGEVLLYVG